MFKKNVWLIDCEEESEKTITLAVYSKTYRFFKPTNKVCYPDAQSAWESAVREVEATGKGTVYMDSGGTAFEIFQIPAREEK